VRFGEGIIMEQLSQSEIEFITQCLKATRKLHNSKKFRRLEAATNFVFIKP
jgi:hypothetical protein